MDIYLQLFLIKYQFNCLFCLSLKVSPTTPLCLFRPSRRDHQPAGSGRSGPDPSEERSETADPIVDEN